MQWPFPWLRPLGGVTSMLLGCAMVLASLMAMNRESANKPQAKRATKTHFSVPPRRRPPRRRKVRPRPRPRPQPRSSRAPRPRLSTALSQFGTGIPMLAATGLGQASDKLLGQTQNARDLVMTEKAVDQLPQATHRVVPKFPARARAKGITGFVRLRLLIGSDGQVLEVQVEDSKPKGTFDQVATAAVRQWRFKPATYKGQPVKIWASKTLRFELR